MATWTMGLYDLSFHIILVKHMAAGCRMRQLKSSHGDKTPSRSQGLIPVAHTPSSLLCLYVCKSVWELMYWCLSYVGVQGTVTGMGDGELGPPSLMFKKDLLWCDWLISMHTYAKASVLNIMSEE